MRHKNVIRFRNYNIIIIIIYNAILIGTRRYHVYTTCIKKKQKYCSRSKTISRFASISLDFYYNINHLLLVRSLVNRFSLEIVDHSLNILINRGNILFYIIHD